jgi:cyclic pyranopterin phosphate synthase
MKELLTFEEIMRVCHQGAALGIRYIKITGGEPLVRKGCSNLIKMIKAIPGIEKVTITTNGVLLLDNLDDLEKAGIDGINISMDTLNPESFKDITGFNGVQKILEGVEESVERNIPVKINSVLLSGKNEEDWQSLMQVAKEMPVDIRFIEMMPIGYGKLYKSLNNNILLNKIKEKYHNLELDLRKHGYGPAVYYHVPEFQGSIGFISAVHNQFCSDCNRIRLTAQGFLKSCLCYDKGIDLKKILINNSKEELLIAMKEVILNKPQGHCFKNPEQITESRAMVGIGG